MLQTLDSWERLQIADALEPRTFPAGTIVMRQNDSGDDFYMIIEVFASAVFNFSFIAICGWQVNVF